MGEGRQGLEASPESFAGHRKKPDKAGYCMTGVTEKETKLQTAGTAPVQVFHSWFSDSSREPCPATAASSSGSAGSTCSSPAT